MSSLYGLSNRSQLIVKHAKRFLSEYAEMLGQARLYDALPVEQEVGKLLYAFYTRLNTSGFVPVPPGAAPRSDDINAMAENIAFVLDNLTTEYTQMSGDIASFYEEETIQYKAMAARVGSLLADIAIGEEKTASKRDAQDYMESFSNTDRFDMGMVNGQVASVAPGDGALTLFVESSLDLTQNLLASISAGSSGFPGNTHTAVMRDGRLYYYGQDNMHMDAEACVDGNDDSWFEYERFMVDGQVLSKTGGYGFSYKEGAMWADASAGSKLNLTVSLDVPAYGNRLSIKPYGHDSNGTLLPRLDSISVSDGKGAVSKFGDGARLEDDNLFLFDRQTVKSVALSLRQDFGQYVEAGHRFGTDLATGLRVAVPAPSVRNVGLVYDPVSKTYIQNADDVSDPAFDNSAKSALFDVTDADDGRVSVRTELIHAYRYLIALRSISLAYDRFSPSSTYISTRYTSENPLTLFEIDAHEYVPPSFGVGDWIVYSLSVDDGVTWHEIEPLHRGYKGKCRYVVNDATPLAQRNAHIGYIETTEPVLSFRVRIVISRPALAEDDAYLSPYVTQYTVKTTKGGLLI